MEKEIDREKLEALVELLEKIEQLDFDEMMGLIICRIRKTLNIERCSIFKVDPDLEKAYLIAGSPEEGHGLGMSFSFSELPAIKEVVETQEYLLIPDPGNDARMVNTKPLIYHENINAMLFLPLTALEKVIGVIVVDATKEKLNFDQQDIYFCINVARLISLLLERDVLFKEKAEKENLAILGRATAEVAHKIRNPLAAIGGFARRMLKKESQCQETFCHSYHKIIVAEVDKIERIIDDTLRLSRDKKNKLDQVEIDVNLMLKGIEDKLIFSFEDKKIQIESSLEPELPHVFGEYGEIEEVFSSIIRNAIEEIETEGDIYIKTKKDDSFIKVSIGNTGGCIPEELVHKIFNPFFTTKESGTGLGLFIARQTVNDYGGEIKVKADKQLGLTTFVVKLPLYQERRE